MLAALKTESSGLMSFVIVALHIQDQEAAFKTEKVYNKFHHGW